MRRSTRDITGRITDVIVILALVTALGIGLLVIAQARKHQAKAEAALHQLETTLSGSRSAALELIQDPVQLQSFQGNLATLDAELQALERITRPVLPLTPYLGWIPGIGPDIRAAPQLLELALDSSAALRTLGDSLLPLAQQVAQAGTGLGQFGPEIVAELTRAQPQIDQASSTLERAAAARRSLDADSLSPSLQRLLEKFDRYWPLLKTGTQALTLAPDLLGADDKSKAHETILSKGGNLSYPTVIVDDKIVIAGFRKAKLKEELGV